MDYGLAAFVLFGCVMMGFLVRDILRHRRRKNSLRWDADTGVYIWIEFDGSERSSPNHPGEQGGAWSDSDGDGGGDGGD